MILGRFDEPAGAPQVAAELGIEGREIKLVGAALRALEERGLAMQLRPGRWVASGTGGEFPVDLQAGAGGSLVARFADGVERPVAALHQMGARPGDRALALASPRGEALLTRLVTRDGRLIIGTLNFRYGRAFLVTDRRREGQLEVLGDDGGVLDRYRAGDRVVGRLLTDEFGRDGVRLVRILDESSPEVADFTQVALGHDLPGEFPAPVLAAAEASASDFAVGSRRDLRAHLVFTIDPDTAKDFDDAISLEELGSGRVRVGVHIADVSHFVAQGSPLDLEAAARGTSCYLVNRVIPMLPERLSNGLCSLVPDEDRYTLSVFIELDRQRKVVGVELAESIIRSRHRLTYEEALAILEERHDANAWPADLVALVRRIGRLTAGIRQDRERAGALNLFSVEQRFALDVDGNPVEVAQETSDIAHQLIEELMLLANRCVARWLADRGDPVVYRLHGEPDQERLDFFAGILEGYGLGQQPVHDRFALQRLLARLEGEPPAARLVLNYLCLRCFQKAYYGVENIGHHALAFSHYCHFTSPIRRYPDLLVHRLVKRGLGLAGYGGSMHELEELDALAKRSSFLERRAEDAERELRGIKAARYLDRRIGDTFQGVVMGVSSAGLYLHLLEVGLDALLPLRELDDDFYSVDRERLAVVGRRSGRVLGVGTELAVQVVNVDISVPEVVLGLAGKADRGRGQRA